MGGVRTVIKKRTRWNFCRIKNDETEELVPVFLPDIWWYGRGKKIKWKNQVWTITFCRKTPPYPFLDW